MNQVILNLIKKTNFIFSKCAVPFVEDENFFASISMSFFKMQCATNFITWFMEKCIEALQILFGGSKLCFCETSRPRLLCKESNSVACQCWVETAWISVFQYYFSSKRVLHYQNGMKMKWFFILVRRYFLTLNNTRLNLDHYKKIYYKINHST